MAPPPPPAARGPITIFEIWRHAARLPYREPPLRRLAGVAAVALSTAILAVLWFVVSVVFSLAILTWFGHAKIVADWIFANNMPSNARPFLTAAVVFMAVYLLLAAWLAGAVALQARWLFVAGNTVPDAKPPGILAMFRHTLAAAWGSSLVAMFPAAAITWLVLAVDDRTSSSGWFLLAIAANVAAVLMLARTAMWGFVWLTIEPEVKPWNRPVVAVWRAGRALPWRLAWRLVASLAILAGFVALLAWGGMQFSMFAGIAVGICVGLIAAIAAALALLDGTTAWWLHPAVNRAVPNPFARATTATTADTPPTAGDFQIAWMARVPHDSHARKNWGWHFVVNFAAPIVLIAVSLHTIHREYFATVAVDTSFADGLADAQFEAVPTADNAADIYAKLNRQIAAADSETATATWTFTRQEHVKRMDANFPAAATVACCRAVWDAHPEWRELWERAGTMPHHVRPRGAEFAAMESVPAGYFFAFAGESPATFVRAIELESRWLTFRASNVTDRELFFLGECIREFIGHVALGLAAHRKNFSPAHLVAIDRTILAVLKGFPSPERTVIQGWAERASAFDWQTPRDEIWQNFKLHYFFAHAQRGWATAGPMLQRLLPDIGRSNAEIAAALRADPTRYSPTLADCAALGIPAWQAPRMVMGATRKDWILPLRAILTLLNMARVMLRIEDFFLRTGRWPASLAAVMQMPLHGPWIGEPPVSFADEWMPSGHLLRFNFLTAAQLDGDTDGALVADAATCATPAIAAYGLGSCGPDGIWDTTGADFGEPEFSTTRAWYETRNITLAVPLANPSAPDSATTEPGN